MARGIGLQRVQLQGTSPSGDVTGLCGQKCCAFCLHQHMEHVIPALTSSRGSGKLWTLGNKTYRQQFGPLLSKISLDTSEHLLFVLRTLNPNMRLRASTNVTLTWLPQTASWKSFFTSAWQVWSIFENR